MKEKQQKIKRVVIGDIHGRVDIFNKIYEKENAHDGDRHDFILLGDYLDTHEDISSSQQVDGLNHLLEVQNHHLKNHGKFIMLMGNHDFHYWIDDPHERYSGYNIKTAVAAQDSLRKAVKDRRINFSYCDVTNRTIYTHAGVSNTWINKHQEVPIPINMIDLANTDSFKFTYGRHMDPYGDDPLNGPLWIRPSSLLSDLYEDFDNDAHKVTTWTQVVGHTSCVKPIICHEDKSQWHDTEEWWMAKFYDLDCLSHGYYMVEELDEEEKVVNRVIKNINE